MITLEIMEKVKNSNKPYNFYIQEDYVYMIRSGDYQDEIEKTKRLHDKGINFAGPISQISFGENKVLVEEYLAKGTSFEKFPEEYNYSSSMDTKEIYNGYIELFTLYFEEIIKRAKANQSIYDKFVSDLIEMNNENLTLDICSLGNLFFDEQRGFSIIDAYPGNKIPNIDGVFRMIIGYVPTIICRENQNSIDFGVPIEYYEKFNISILTIMNKLNKSLGKYGYNYKLNKSNYSYNRISIENIEELNLKEKLNGIRLRI